MAKSCQLIPQPPPKPFLGNVTDIDPKNVTHSLTRLAEKYGPIYRLKFPHNNLVVLSTWEGVNEACDDERFEKSIEGDLDELRAAVNDGLFTSKGESEENWGIAHRVLVSAFGPLSIRAMFNEMHEVASQLALKWCRQGSGVRLDISEDFTRLTLDTVALCSMGFRFNSYYSQTLHPFIQAMAGVLTEAGKKTQRPFHKIFYRSADKKFRANTNLLRSTARQVLDSRKINKDNARPRKDLLSAMLSGVDPKTGKTMSDESIIDNLITFLVAGHETTAGTLSFMMYSLLKNPETYRKAQKEVDEVIGTGAIKLEHIPKLKYINAAIRETLRLSAPITAFVRKPKQDTTILGKFPITTGDQLLCYLAMSHRDPEVYGPTADNFDPERMLDENFDRISREYPHSWKPFGTGMRACIGRPFAWQEMVLAWAVMLQNFDFEMDDPSYKLSLQETLTIRPKDFFVKARPRGGMTPIELEARLAGSFLQHNTSDAIGGNAIKAGTKTGRRLAIFYGSDSGTCEYMAHKLASDAARHGYDAFINPLDSAKDDLPKDTPVVILTASYEGQPPHNATKFVKWTEGLEGSQLAGVSYSVWGCGHADWVKTYQRIPKLVDSKFQEHGAARMTAFACTDAKDRDMFSDFESWTQQTLWPAIKQKFGGTNILDQDTSSLKVSFSTPRITSLHQDVKEAIVTEARSLTKDDSFGEKRHLEIRLPTGMTYITGDYLAILPLNPREVVNRTLRRFELAWDAHIFIQTTGHTSLPVDMSVPVSDVLSSYVELSTIATRRNITALAQHTTDPKLTDELRALASDDDYECRVRAKKVSVLDILEWYPSLTLPFEQFLALLPPMRARQYSISSTPLVDPGVVTLTYSVLNEPALSGQGQYVGVATSYLACLRPGDKVQVAVRSANGGFRLPDVKDPTPCIFIGAGTGLAPLRSFVQERAIRGENASKALLFFGCRSPEVDDLYREEFDQWESQGAVKVYRAFSRKPEISSGCKYVQALLLAERDTISSLWREGAKIFVCGSSKVADGVKDALVQIIVEEQAGMTKEMAEKWFEEQRNERYAVDVFD